jgi:hypothetical protein
VFFALAFCAIAYFKSTLGKPQMGVLKVPLGRDLVSVAVYQSSCLKPYKYDQTFDAVVLPGVHALKDEFDGRRQSGEGAISYKGTILGFADTTDSSVLALVKLAGAYKKVVVQAVILSIDHDGRPIIQLKLPNASWFKRARSEAEKSDGKRA